MKYSTDEEWKTEWKAPVKSKDETTRSAREDEELFKTENPTASRNCKVETEKISSDY